MDPNSTNPEKATDQNSAEVIKVLCAEITTLAKAKRFTEAEAVREKLIEVAPTALSEIIGTAGIIEEEKTAGLDADHLAIWDSLYSGLNEEETNRLFYSLEQVIVPPKTRILTQGGYNTRLYLIDKGTVSVINQKNGKQSVLAQLGRGDMLGEYTFTTISVCSASVFSRSEVHLRYLESATTDNWHRDFPILLKKLTGYCTLYGQVKVIEARHKKEEESIKHYNVDGVATAFPMTKDGLKSESYFKGGLTDISTVGCCFDIKSSKRESARALLGRTLTLTLAITRSENCPTIEAIGKVERVSFHLHNDYTVSVTFADPLIEGDLKEKIAEAR